VNCPSIIEKRAEFAAGLECIKPDIVCGTESWLKGVRPTWRDPTGDQIKSCEIIPDNYTAYRNDRGTLGGGIFVLVENGLVSVEHPEFVTDCELVWAKIKTQGDKDLYVGSFYMPHRNHKDLAELEKSLAHLSSNNKNQKHVILAGDFNCPDIDWETSAVHANCTDRSIHQKLIDIPYHMKQT